MVSIHTRPAERVTAKLAEQASAHTQIAATLTAEKKPTAEARAWATEHLETAQLFTLLHTAVTGGLLEELQAGTGA